MQKKQWGIYLKYLNKKVEINEFKEKNMFLIREYINGNYEAEIFCDEYTQNFNIGLDYNTLNEDTYQTTK